MKKYYILFLVPLFILSKKATAQTYDWTQTFGSTTKDLSHASTVDSNGNIYLSGSFTGTVDFDGTGTFTATSEGNEDIFLIKYNASGAVQWVKTYGGSENDKGASVITDSAGNVYFTGDFKSEHVNFGGTATDISTKGEEDIFLIKLDTDGNFLWFHNYGNTAKDAGISLDFDTQGDLLVTGFFALTGRFNPDNTSDTITSAGQIDVFVLKLDTAGNYKWVKGFGGPNLDKGLFLKTDYNDNIIVTGYFYDTIDCDPGTATTQVEAHTSNGQRDFYIVKLDSTGNHIWSGNIGGTLDDRALSIAIDDTNNLYFCGFFAETVDFDMGVGTHNLTANGNDDAFFFKMDENGVLKWVKQIGGIDYDIATEIIIDNNGDLLLTGSFANTVDFDTSTTTHSFTSNGLKDIFILKTDIDGNYSWNIALGNALNDEAFSINVDTSNNIITAGSFSTNVNFDFGSGTDFHSSNGERDVFVTKITHNTASIDNPFFQDAVTIYPNPVINRLQISSTAIIKKVEIYTLFGKLINQFYSTKTITTKNLSTGMYILKLYNEEGNMSTHKFIKL